MPEACYVKRDTNVSRRLQIILNVPGAPVTSILLRWLLAGCLVFQVAAALADTAVTVAGHSYALTPHPRVLFDGPDGALTTRLKDPDGAGPKVAPQAHDANPAFVALKHHIRECVGAPAACRPDAPAAFVLLAALDWFMDNSQAGSLAAARHWLNHIEDVATAGVGFGCDVTLPDCGRAALLDQASADLAMYALAYTLVRAQLSAAERETFARKMLNDVRTTYGDTCRNQLQASNGSATLRPWDGETCGLVWMLRNHGYNPQGRTIGFAKTSLARAITAEQSSITVRSRTGLPGTTPYFLSINGREAVEVTAAEQNELTVRRGQLGTTAAAAVSGKPVYYTRVVPNIGTDDYAHSSVIQKLYGYAFIGNALADDSEAARALLDVAVDDWLKYVHPKNKDMWTGFQQGGSSDFGSARQLTQNAAMTALLTRFGGAPSLDTSGGDWLKRAVPAYLYSTLPPAPEQLVPWGQPAVARSPSYPSHQWAAILSGLYGPESDESKYWNHWQRRVTAQYSAERLRREDAVELLPFALMYYQESDPGADYRNAYLPQRAFTRVDGTASRALAAWISRTGWSDPGDTLIFANAFPSAWSLDHIGAGAPAAYKIYRNGWVLTENGPNDTGAGIDTNMPIFGDAASLTPSRLVSVTRVSNDDRDGAYAYIQINSQAAYHARANVIRSLRSIVHLKEPGTQDYVVVYDSLESSAGTAKTIHLYFDKTDGEASTMTSSTLPTFGWTAPNRALSIAVVMPSGAVATYSSLPDAHRVAVCVSADGKSCDTENRATAFLMVHRPSVRTADAMPAATLLSRISAEFVGVQIEGDGPKVAVFPAGGVPRAGVSFTTTHRGTAQVLVTGIEAGVYDVKRNGTTVCGGIAVNAAAETVYCKLEAGSIEVAPVTAAEQLSAR